jgi:hypothetical protein
LPWAGKDRDRLRHLCTHDRRRRLVRVGHGFGPRQYVGDLQVLHHQQVITCHQGVDLFVMKVLALVGDFTMPSRHNASWGRFVSVLRAKAEEAGRTWIEIDPGTRRTTARNAVTQHPKTASPKRTSSASDARIAPKRTRWPHATSCGPDGPFTPKPREKKPAVWSGRRSRQPQPSDNRRTLKTQDPQ